MAHLLGVAALVLGECGHVPFTVTEDLIIAALLHERSKTRADCLGCTTSRPTSARKSPPSSKVAGHGPGRQQQEGAVGERKESYIARLWNESQGTLLVSLADKLYNARAILEDYRISGRRFGSASSEAARNSSGFRRTPRGLQRGCPGWRIVEELKRTVDELRSTLGKRALGRLAARPPNGRTSLRLARCNERVACSCARFTATIPAGTKRAFGIRFAPISAKMASALPPVALAIIPEIPRLALLHTPNCTPFLISPSMRPATPVWPSPAAAYRLTVGASLVFGSVNRLVRKAACHISPRWRPCNQTPSHGAAR